MHIKTASDEHLLKIASEYACRFRGMQTRRKGTLPSTTYTRYLYAMQTSRKRMSNKTMKKEFLKHQRNPEDDCTNSDMFQITRRTTVVYTCAIYDLYDVRTHINYSRN